MANEKQYNWIELAGLRPDGAMVRKEYVRIDDIEAIEKWRARFDNTDIFTSIGLYNKPDYSSECIYPYFADIDSPDLLSARESCLILCEMLMDRIGIKRDQLGIFLSGRKGFHVTIDCKVFRMFYSPHILRLFKVMAEKAEQAGVKCIDRGVYTAKRLWRMPNSINSKSGLYKIALFYEELRDTSADGILEWAKNQRAEEMFFSSPECKHAVTWYQTAISRMKNKAKNRARGREHKDFKDGWREPPCIRALESSVLPDGIRHQAYLALARFFRWVGMHPDEMLERIRTIDQENPIREPDSIARAVEFGCKAPGFPGCNDPALQMYCQKERCFYAEMKASQREE